LAERFDGIKAFLRDCVRRMSANGSVCNRPGVISGPRNHRGKYGTNNAPERLARGAGLPGLNNEDFVRRDEIERRSNLLVEQIGVDMIRVETRDLVGERIVLGLDGSECLLSGVQLLSDVSPSTQTPIALKGVIDKIRGERRSK
jgi:hypothetical protein